MRCLVPVAVVDNGKDFKVPGSARNSNGMDVVYTDGVVSQRTRQASKHVTATKPLELTILGSVARIKVVIIGTPATPPVRAA